MKDETESIRREMLATGQPYKDLALIADHMRWAAEQLAIDFEILGFLAPFVVVRRKADGVVGSVEFTHYPRYYFDFKPDKKP